MNSPVNLRKPVSAVARPVRRDFRPARVPAMHDEGVIWADEIFQTLEQGHRLAFGYGLVPWEYQSGARSGSCPG